MKNWMIVFVCALFIKVNAQNEYFDKLAHSKEMSKGEIGFYAYNVTKDKVHDSYNAEKWLAPASILKLVTTSIAIDILGANYQFETKVAYSGTINANVLDGDLIIVGGGDPTLGFNIIDGKPFFPEAFFNDISAALTEKGIDSVNGNLIIDNSHFSENPTPSGWAWGDIGNYYGTGSHSLNFYGNRFSVFFKSGKLDGSSTTIAEVFPRLELKFRNEVKTANINSDQAYIYSSPWSKEIFMEGRIPMDKSKFEVKGALPNPPQFFLETLMKQLNSRGISTKGEFLVSQKGKKYKEVLCNRKSPMLKDIASYTNRKSDNFFAETLLKAIGKSRGEGSTANGLRVIQSYLSERNINPGNFNTTDGSGLSRNNLITAKGMCDLLKMNLKNAKTNFTELGLSIAGKTGSFRRLGKGACYEGALRGKSGYMRNVRSYAGIYQNEQGERIVYCVMLNDFNCSAGKAREIIGEILANSFCP